MTNATVDEAARSAWDVCIVGAGPAGAMAAHETVRAGLRVLLVEKSAFPREKVCGCCLNGVALAQLSASGMDDLIEATKAVRLHDMLLAGRATRATLLLPNSVALSRATLDSALVARSGAAFLPETSARIGGVSNGHRTVRLTSKHGIAEIRAAVVIAADGLAGTSLTDVPEFTLITRRNSRFGVGAIVEAAPSSYAPGRLYMAVGRGGYVGLVRLEDGRLDIAAAFDMAFTRKLGGISGAVAQTMREAGLDAIELPGDRFWRGTPALTRRINRVSAERLFVIGDAAGYVEPITGEGMAWALTSGARVAPTAIAAVQKWTPALSFVWKRGYAETRARQRTCAVLAGLLRSRVCTRAALTVLASFPSFAQPLIARLNAG